MCGRFAFFSPADAIRAAFGTDIPQEFAEAGELAPGQRRYNIAPTQQVLTIVADRDGKRLWRALQWGLVPFWAKDPAIGNRMINARVETVREKPAYRQPFARRRCIVPASGFYEWRKDSAGNKTPWYISRADGLPLAMAGIWDRWDGAPERPLFSFSILTTAANPFMRDLHDRMPVILEPNQLGHWLARDAHDGELQAQVAAPVTIELQAWPVSRAVNSPLQDQPGLVEPRPPP